MKIFERITKRPALLNYYLRRSFYWPDTLPEVLDYWQQHNELPFLYGGDNWPYDAMCERQRRKGCLCLAIPDTRPYGPPDGGAGRAIFSTMTAVSIGRLLRHGATYTPAPRGRAPSALLGFDADAELVDLYAFLSRSCRTADTVPGDRFPLRERHRKSAVRDCGCVSFLQWLSCTQHSGDRAVLLLPYGFIDKPCPKSVQETMRHFIVRHRTPMQEPFARTNCRAEIVVVERA